jgi:hypothetical protein
MRDITSFMVFFTQIPRVGGVQAGMPVISQRVKVQKNLQQLPSGNLMGFNGI